jgi:prepilin-type N-terminal cleavage/methylation domain-containing protein
MNNYKKGFTLVELLLVIVIIGLLSAVVVVSLTDSRKKGSDAGVKNNLSAARSQGEVFYNTNTSAPNSYTSVCTNGVVGGAQGVGLAVLTAAKAVGLSSYAVGASGTTTTATCNDSATAWAAEVPLKGGGMWCVDSTGRSLKKNDTSLTALNGYYDCL